MATKDSTSTLTNSPKSKSAANTNGGHASVSLPAIPAMDQKEGKSVEEKNLLQFQSIPAISTKTVPDPISVVQKKVGENTSEGIPFKPSAAGQEKRIEQVNPLQFETADSLASGGAAMINAFKPIQKKGNNTGLPDDLKSGIENISGFDMGDVKVHYNSSQPAQLSALAYAQGTDIHVGPGQEKHLPHEAWHVVQQKQGRVQATTQMKQGVPVNDDAGLEKEADEMGAKALQKKDAAENKGLENNRAYSNTVQMVAWTAADVTAAAGLSAELAAGYALATGSPAAKPASPAWLRTRVEQETPWNAVAEAAACDLQAQDIWDNKLPAAAKVGKTEAAWVAAKSTELCNAKHAKQQNAWTVRETYLWNNEAKWNATFNNTDGFLPGVAGAGGYSEYYAEPSTPVGGVAGFWGRNRLLRDTTGAGTYANNWWATSDHYTNFTRVT